MNRRRGLIGAYEQGLDTTPVIMEYNKQWNSSGNTESKNGYCVTEKYKVPWTAGMKYKVKTSNTASHSSRICAWTGNETNFSTSWERSSGEINVNYTFANCWLSCTLETADIDDCYLYENNSGNIIFAGRNTPFYGKQNINE